MEPMKIEEGMVCKYWDENCVLEVRILSYNRLTNKELFDFEPLKDLSPTTKCPYKIGKKFSKERTIGDEKGLWGLIFNFK